MAKEGISVEGLNLLLRNLRRVDSEYPRQAKQLHEKIASPVATRAKSKARKLSGRMAGTIRAYATQRRAQVGAGARTKYTGVQHYGWPGHGISPNPFLTDAITEMQSQILLVYDREMDAWIDRIWRDNR